MAFLGLSHLIGILNFWAIFGGPYWRRWEHSCSSVVPIIPKLMAKLRWSIKVWGTHYDAVLVKSPSSATWHCLRKSFLTILLLIDQLENLHLRLSMVRILRVFWTLYNFLLNIGLVMMGKPLLNTSTNFNKMWGLNYRISIWCKETQVRNQLPTLTS